MSNKPDSFETIKAFTDLTTRYFAQNSVAPFSNFFSTLLKGFTSGGGNGFLPLLQKVIFFFTHYPEKFNAINQEYVTNLSNLWQKQVEGGSYQATDVESFINPERADRRFKDSQWENHPFYKTIMQSYLLWVKWLTAIIDAVPDLDSKTRSKLHFYVRQFTDLMAPTNLFWLNPETIRTTIETQGQNLIQGLSNFMRDFDHHTGQLQMTMVDKQAFKVGDNIAITPGQVIFRNELFELINYTPTTPTIYDIPLLIVPPCINKFYVFDLRPEKSFVKWCCDHGLSVYIISWVNPDRHLAHKTFDDYVVHGVHCAVQQVLDHSRQSTVNTVGFCIGGNLLNSLDAYLTHIDPNNNPLRSTTFLATIFDFHNAGDLSVIFDEQYLAVMENQSKIDGYICGRVLAQCFNALRANDLIWSFMIHNYYLGKAPEAVDFLYWNADSTCLPSTMYIQYLRKFFLENCPMNPGVLSINDLSIDFSKIKTPSYILNTKSDHIAPWKSGYAALSIFGQNSQFVLGGSGHIAGIFNPPHKSKYSFWHNDNIFERPEEWFDCAQEQTGSWWDHWLDWIKGHSGELREVTLTSGDCDNNLGPAPGSYVHNRSTR